MCDFRIIKKIQLLDGTIIETDAKPIHPDSIKNMKDVEEPGLYSICATGGYYLYYDGNEWLTEYKENDEYYSITVYKKGYKVIDYSDSHPWYTISGAECKI